MDSLAVYGRGKGRRTYSGTVSYTHLHAARIALEYGYRHFYIYGGLGGRLAHTIANIQLLEHIAEQGGRAYLVGTGETLTVLRNGRLEFLPEAKGYISIFAVNGPAYGLSLIHI